MYIMRMRIANTFALEALKRSITSVVVLHIQSKWGKYIYIYIRVFYLSSMNLIVKLSCIIGIMFDCLLGWRSKWEGIQASSRQDSRQLLGCWRWLKNSGYIYDHPLPFSVVVFCGMRTSHNYHIQKHVCMLMQSHILKAFTQKLSLQNRGPFKIKYFILKCTKWCLVYLIDAEFRLSDVGCRFCYSSNSL